MFENLAVGQRSAVCAPKADDAATEGGAAAAAAAKAAKASASAKAEDPVDGEQTGKTLKCVFSHPGVASEELKTVMFDMLRDNMRDHYIAAHWGWDDGAKQRELFDPEARYIVVYDADKPVAYLHYRFVYEAKWIALYIYELQVLPEYQGYGIGKHLMRLSELAAMKHSMTFVMLTVFAGNTSALKFYKQRMKYVVSELSPSRTQPQCPYQILWKIVSPAERKRREDLRAQQLAARLEDGIARGVISKELVAAVAGGQGAAAAPESE